VYIFGDYTKEVFVPVGTCFTISERHLLTAQYSMDGKRRDGYAIAQSVSRQRDRSGAERVDAMGLVTAEVIYYNSGMDYAIIEVNPKSPLVPIPISIRNIEGDTDLKVLHAPIGLFNQYSSEHIGIFSAWLKSSTPIDGHHILCTGGLFAGSSGAPLLTVEEYAVGMHVLSDSEAREANVSEEATQKERNEIFSDSINSNSHVHSSIIKELCIGACRKLLEVLGKL